MGGLLVVAAEVRGLVVLARTPLDLFLFGEQTLEVGVGLAEQRARRGLLVGTLARLCGRGHRRAFLLGPPPPAAARTDDPAPGRLARSLADGHRRLPRDLVLDRAAVRQDVALVDPDLHADASERRTCLGEAVVDVGPQCVQRHATLAVPLLAAHLGAAEATRALHANPLRAGLHRGLHRALHRAPERHSPGELVGDTLRKQGRVDLGLLDLLDVELDLRVAADLPQTFAQALGLRAATTDDDAGSRGPHIDAQPIAGPFDLDASHRGPLQLAAQVVADLPVFDQLVAVFLLPRDPARLPIGRDAEPEPVRIDLLAHYLSSSSVSSSSVSSSSVSSSSGASSSGASSAASVSAAASASASASAASASSVSSSASSSDSISSSVSSAASSACA